jgi:hypothetical protein
MVFDLINTSVLVSFQDAVGEMDALPVVALSLNHRLQAFIPTGFSWKPYNHHFDSFYFALAPFSLWEKRSDTGAWYLPKERTHEDEQSEEIC